MSATPQRRPINSKVAFHIQAAFATILFLIPFLREEPLPDGVSTVFVLSLSLSLIGACVAWLRWNREEDEATNSRPRAR